MPRLPAGKSNAGKCPRGAAGTVRDPVRMDVGTLGAVMGGRARAAGFRCGGQPDAGGWGSIRRGTQIFQLVPGLEIPGRVLPRGLGRLSGSMGLRS
jgi:hypothetical protein